MKKRSLEDWSAISEIVGTVAVVASLVLVVHSIDRNTAATQVANENFLYELTDSSMDTFVNNQYLLESFIKARDKRPLSDTEKLLLELHVMRMMNRWNLAFDRYQEGMFAPDKWEAWNTNYLESIPRQYLRDWWAEYSAGYGIEFSDYIESVISGE